VIARAPRRQDALIAAAVAAGLALEVALSPSTDRLALTLALLVPAGLLVLWRRTHPVLVVAGIGALYVASSALATGITEYAATMVPVLLGYFAVGRHSAGVRVAAVVAVLTIVGVNLGERSGSADDWVFPFVLVGAAGLTGRALRNRALVAAELAERTERLALEHDLRAAEAAHAERRRIARELHDVIAHTLSVMVVQAGAARRTVGRDVDRAEEALVTVEATGRAALHELRRLLGFVGEAPGDAPLGPQPTTADIARLVRRAGAAGLPTRLDVQGTPGPLPAGAEVAVYRIVQEALTNALKHAGHGATATVRLRWLDDALELEVADDGGGAAVRAGAVLPGGGHGLVGMRERVALYRGEVEAGPLATGGFAVRARLPREGAMVPA
jgi:signal transduction histidine kinase